MSYDEDLAGRIRKLLVGRAGVAERKMFGGLAFLLDGSMFCGIVGQDLMVRVGPERYDEALSQSDVRPMDFTGRPAKGYVYVSPGGCRSEKALNTWIERGADFVSSMPPKNARVRKPRRRPTQDAHHL